MLNPPRIPACHSGRRGDEKTPLLIPVQTLRHSAQKIPLRLGKWRRATTIAPL
jgi:hypothetical protein